MTWLFSSAILLNSCLLFLVQPLCAKMLLPFLGGTPAVWNTCMVFFQAGLLLGYAYAHYVPLRLGIGRQGLLHLVLWMLTYFTLPIRFPDEMPADCHPVLWLLAMLARHVGLPFVLLAAGAPLLQRWFVCKTLTAPRDPYFLYAASNLGSFVALALFPFALEPYFSLREMSELWTFGFLLLAALLAFCVPLRVHFSAEEAAIPTPAPVASIRARWIVLAMIPSSLLLSVTTYATTDIAAIPLLWLIPMGIYLLTFTLAFSGRPILPQPVLIRWLPLVVLVLTVLMLSEAAEPMPLVLGLHLFGLFWLALACHGELSRTRPAAEYLTMFYLCLAIGGVLGGVLNALIAPLLFRGLLEYPLMIVLACYFAQENADRPTRNDLQWAAGLGVLTAVLVLVVQSRVLVSLEPGPTSVAVIFGLPLIRCYVMQFQRARFALSLGAVLLASGLYDGVHGALAYRERSWFGIHRVTELDGFHRLVHGNTVHGQQDPRRPREPLTYYSRVGPIGDLFQSLHDDARLREVGVIGLGTGSLAAYAQPDQDWTFFEIDPSVQHIAENPKLFTFLRDARTHPRCSIRVELGDARLRLEASSQKFGLLVVDAFGSDAIPVHLLTREALHVYLDRLQPNGILAFHISNNYVDLEPVLAKLAADARPPLTCQIYEQIQAPAGAAEQGIFASVWVVMERKTDDAQPLLRSPPWRPARVRPGMKVWTDDSSNLFQAFRLLHRDP